MTSVSPSPRVIPMLALLLVGLLLSSCGGGGTTPTDSPPVILSVSLPGAVMLGSTIQLSANAQGTVDTWQWTLGEGAPGIVADERPSFRFAQLGLFHGSVIATNAAGASAPFEFTTKVIAEGVSSDPPVIQSVGPIGTVGFEGQRVGFLATATNFPDTWEWSFPGGGLPATSTSSNPQIILTQEGTNAGSVVVSNRYGPSERFDFTYIVTAPEIDRSATIRTLSIGGEMGEPGTQVQPVTETFDFPTNWDWDFGAGSNPTESPDPDPVFTLGPPNLYTGSLVVSNRFGGDAQPFIFSTGGFESARMAQHYGGLINGASDFIPLSQGRVAAQILTSIVGTYDLDPRMTTMQCGHPQFGPTLPAVGPAVVITDTTGAPDRLLQWDADLALNEIARGPQDNLLVRLWYNASTSLPNPAQINIAPGPGVLMVAGGDTSQIIVLGVSYDGQVQWGTAEAIQKNRSGGHMITGPDGSVFFTSTSADFSGGNFVKLRKLTPQGDPVWQATLPFEPGVIRGTPSGGVYYADVMTHHLPEDLDGSVDGVDMRSKIGISDAFVTRLSATGAYMHSWQLGGPGLTDMTIPTDLLVRPDSSIVLAGSWNGGELDFDPGPGVHLESTEICTPAFPFTPRVYALHLDVNGAIRSVEVWDSFSELGAQVQLADFGDSGYAIGWRLSQCSTPDRKDLDPGPGTRFPSSFSDIAVVRIDADGNLTASAEWDTPSGTVQRLTSTANGGLHLLVNALPTDMDPGPGIFDPSPLSAPSTPWHIFLDEALAWSTPLQ